MSLATWPTDLPQFFEQEGYGEQLADVQAEFQPDIGAAKGRPRFTKNYRLISGAIRCTEAQSESFDTFYHDTLAGGVLDFFWVSPIRQGLAIMRFRNAPPAPVEVGEDQVLIQLNLFQKTLPAKLRGDTTTVTADSTIETADEANSF